MKKRFSEEQIIGFLREAEAGIAIKDLCRGFYPDITDGCKRAATF